jgi:hypothetical protein
MEKMLKNILGAVLLTMVMISGSFAGPNTDNGIRVNDTLPSAQSVRHITVGIKSGQNFDNTSTGWKVAMIKAIEFLGIEIYDAGSSVNFNWTGHSGADILMEYGSLASDVYATTHYGSSNGIGEKMVINSSRNPSFNTKIKILKHELLHTIGFAHSRTDSESFSVMVPNTNNFWEWQYYGHSIMETSTNRIPFNLSELDKRALRTIFP